MVTAAELLSIAAFDESRYAQAFPSFGSERTGAPVASFCRIDDRPIRSREPVSEPDALVVIDPTLLHQVDVFGGLGDDAYVLINTTRTPPELGLASLTRRLRPGRLMAVAATDLARKHLGRPLPNAAVLGGLAALTGMVSIESVARAIGARFDGAAREGNVSAARAAYQQVARRVARPDRHPALTAGPGGSQHA